MARQERAARRAQWAAKRATQVVAEEKAKVTTARLTPSPSQEGATPETVKHLRDAEGLAWWVIGQRLGLAEHATSASEPEAKRGAGRARTLYAAANRGEVPRTHAPRRGSTPRPQGPGRSGSKVDRKIQLVTQGHVIPRDMPEEEIEALVRGRTIEWAIDMAKLCNTPPESWGREDKRWVNQDARVHPEAENVRVLVDEDTGERVLYFREYAGRDDKTGKFMSGPTRVVRVDAIHTIR